MSAPIQARLFNGTRDILPQEMLARQEMLATMRQVFEIYGFAPLETPVMEYLEVLMGKYGEEGDKLIYPLAYKGGGVLGLRYDLTVPLSRLMAMNRNLPLPFKRYQIQPVYRGDRPQPAQGRFREFYQCDVDTVGSDSLVADAENIAVCHQIYEKLGLGAEAAGLTMRVNHRGILRAMVVAAGLDAEMDGPVCTALDKIDKIGPSKVDELLVQAGIGAEARRYLFDTIQLGIDLNERPGRHEEKLEALNERLGHLEVGQKSLAEMREFFAHVKGLGVPSDVIDFDFVLTRGLDYYTGPIYEFRILKLENFGSLGGGGRYDGLMSVYGQGDMPATGVSIGLSRVQSALIKMGLLKERQTPTQLMVLRLGDMPIAESLALVHRFRGMGIPTELHYDSSKFKKQIGLADKKGIPFVVIQGPDEAQKDLVQVKQLATGEQVELKVDAVAAHLSAKANS